MTLTGKQKKLDKNNDGKISEEDFELLRKEKTPETPKEDEVKMSEGGSIQIKGTKFSGVY